MAASKACQRARAIMPMTAMTSIVLPNGLPARLCSAPDWSLSPLESPRATCRASQAKSRWMTPYTMKPPRARYSRGLLSAARDAVLRACWVADMLPRLTWGNIFETCHPCHPDVLAGNLEADLVGGDAVQRHLEAADV